jgi:hypothetical protein
VSGCKQPVRGKEGSIYIIALFQFRAYTFKLFLLPAGGKQPFAIRLGNNFVFERGRDGFYMQITEIKSEGIGSVHPHHKPVRAEIYLARYTYPLFIVVCQLADILIKRFYLLFIEPFEEKT